MTDESNSKHSSLEEHKEPPSSRNSKSDSRNNFKEKIGGKRSVQAYTDGILNGNRELLSQAITLVESRKPEYYQKGQQILEQCLPHTGESQRIGITGVPGVGKSTLINTLGSFIVNNNHPLAVLAIDPSSSRSGGSILGDKTRMGDLVNREQTFIRPSPTGGSLGGVARKTRESMLLCEAAGFDTIMVETVGVGQSETAVRHMVDCFLLVAQSGGGDELQGIKRGIVEMADIIAVNKAEEPERQEITNTVHTYKKALKLFPTRDSSWRPRVLTCSATNNMGIEKIWNTIQEYIKHISRTGYLKDQRKQQVRQWMYDTINANLREAFYQNEEVHRELKKKEKAVMEGRMSSFKAARELLNLFRKEAD